MKTFHLWRGSFRCEELPVSEEHPRRDVCITTVLDSAFSHNFGIKVHQSQDQSRDIREQHNRMIVRRPGEEELGWTMVPKGRRSEGRIKEHGSSLWPRLQLLRPSTRDPQWILPELVPKRHEQNFETPVRCFVASSPPPPSCVYSHTPV